MDRGLSQPPLTRPVTPVSSVTHPIRSFQSHGVKGSGRIGPPHRQSLCHGLPSRPPLFVFSSDRGFPPFPKSFRNFPVSVKKGVKSPCRHSSKSPTPNSWGFLSQEIFPFFRCIDWGKFGYSLIGIVETIGIKNKLWQRASS